MLDVVNGWLSELLGWISSQPEGWLGWAILFAVAFVAATLIPLGSELWLLTLLAAGWSPSPLLFAATLGNTCGAMTTYYLAYYAGLYKTIPLPVSRRYYWVVSRYRIYGSWTLLFSWLPVIGDVMVFVAGYLRTGWLTAVSLACAK